MKGLVLINAYWRAECVTEQAERIQRELELAGVETDIKRNGFLPCAAGAGIENRIADAYDFCVYLDKDKYVSELLEKSGMRLFNRHEAVRVCDDKMRTYAALAANGIAVPYTVPAPCLTRSSADWVIRLSSKRHTVREERAFIKRITERSLSALRADC